MHALQHLTHPTLKQAFANTCLCWRPLDTHGQGWVSLLWGHCSFLLGPGVHKVLFGPSSSLFPQFCESSAGSIMGLMATSSKRAYAIHTQVYCTQSSCPCGRPLLIRTSTGDTQTLKAGLAPSVWGLLVCTRFCLSPPSVSGGYGI